MKGLVAAPDNVSRPPQLPFVLSVGVTGHRAEVLPEGSIDALRGRIREVLLLVAEAGRKLLAKETDCFSPDPPRLRFVSPVADGADQISAEVALELGWELQVVLPFERARYRESLANHGARERFDALLERAVCVLELPGNEDRQLDAYVMTGRATVSHCDMLIAVWDGLPPRGRGGTGEVVQLAITNGTAVIHLPLDPAAEPRLLWSAFDPTVLTFFDDPTAERPLNHSGMDLLLRGLLMPPPDEQEQDFLKRFTRERMRNIRARIEYPLLLTAAGVRRIKAGDLNAKAGEQQIRDEWRQYRAGCAEAHNISAPIDLLERAYSWADRLATHFAQTYRSGHIFNFVLGAFAVCIGLSAFMAPHLKFEFAALELVITFAIILNAHVGSRQEWHRRWLDYRQLAERLRPMRSLKLLGIASPDPPGTETNPVPKRWIDWYASGIWRAIGCPSGSIDPQCASRLARSIADFEVAPQVDYHERHAAQIDALDERLASIATTLFAATLIVSVATLVGLGIGANFVTTYGNWFTLVSAGFPALGTAVFGIRFQADFGGDALRSLSTANTLRQIEEELRKDVTLSRAADLTEQAARIMLSDLDEWRLVNQQRDLSVG
ncbi:hypothetical protein GCM10022276_18800 [Sphingomonas limnosediminicola]|uniref:SMODS and SLOG-associating 2TM effector domain-containing protein n=1 Tax=Sphingomonas limnosediminicola TaxID=940133 RepID=A0ABP7LE83_9SPHN